MANKFTRNLSRHEFKCKGRNCNCNFDTADFELVLVLQDVVDHFEALEGKALTITITSGCRCVEHNEEVQKIANKNYKPYSSKSEHMEGRAADFIINGVSALRVHDYLVNKYKGRFGIGKYPDRTHIDTRSGPPARW